MNEVISLRKLDSEELHNLYYLPDFITVTNHGGCCRHGREDAVKFRGGNLMERDHLGNLDEMK